MKAPVEIFAEAMVGGDAWDHLSPSLRRLWLEAASAGMAVFADPPDTLLDLFVQAMRNVDAQHTQAGGPVSFEDYARAALLILTMPPINHPPLES